MKIYVSGSMYGGQQKIDTYKKLVDKLEEYGEVLTKQIADPKAIENEKYQKDEDIYNDLENKLEKADILIAEVSVPSIGVGYEICYASKLNKKIVAIYDKNYIDKVTTMIRGNKNIKIIPYKDIREILDKIEEIIS